MIWTIVVVLASLWFLGLDLQLGGGPLYLLLAVALLVWTFDALRRWRLT